MSDRIIYSSPYDDKDYEVFLKNLIKRFEMDLTGYKQHRVRRRIDMLMRKHSFKTYPDYFNKLKDDDLLWDEFLDKLTINVTEFFRNPEKWEYLQKSILPDLFTRSNRLKLWSAGCSTGEEPYTLSMVLEEMNKSNKADIIAADLDKFVLKKAQNGAYEERSMINLSPNFRTKYFDKTADNKFKVKPLVKSNVKFKQLNLLTDRFDKDHDLIICRNVVIYFDNPAKEKLYRKFSEALKPGGILFVGSTERIFNYREIGLKTVSPFFYQKEG